MPEKPSETGRLLSICIPTYNRVDKLRRCIESVLPLTDNGAVVDYLCDRQAAGSCKAVIWDRPLCSVAKSDKTWSREAEDVFYKKIPQWWRLLPKEIRRSKHCVEAYSKYLWFVTNTLWARKTFKWRYVKECPMFSVLGLLKRSVSAFVGRSFRRGGVKYKLFGIGPFRFARRSKRSGLKGILKIKQGKVKRK